MLTTITPLEQLGACYALTVIGCWVMPEIRRPIFVLLLIIWNRSPGRG